MASGMITVTAGSANRSDRGFSVPAGGDMIFIDDIQEAQIFLEQ